MFQDIKKIFFLSLVFLVPVTSFAVSPHQSSNWNLFEGNIVYGVVNNYVSIIYDTNDNGICEVSDLTGAVQVGVSPKGTWAAGLYYLDGASTTTGFTIPALDDYRTRGLCLRYYSTGHGYLIELENAFFYNMGSATTTEELFIGGFSYGDIIQNLFLLMIFNLLFFAELKKWIFGTKVDGVAKIKSYKNFK